MRVGWGVEGEPSLNMCVQVCLPWGVERCLRLLPKLADWFIMACRDRVWGLLIMCL